jgi:3-hydroxyisobutyrate dehydrogenase-like beta-hydroxyacid dehydrogenase
MGSPQAVAAGLGRFLIGGPAEAIEAVAALWGDLGSGYLRCGPSGSGATMKLLSNLLLITGVAALAEAIAIARRQAVSDELVRAVFAESPVVSPTSRLRLENLLDSGHPGWFPPALARKDLALARELGERGGVPARMAPAAEELLTSVIDSGMKWPDFSAVIEAYNSSAAPPGSSTDPARRDDTGSKHHLDDV